MRAPDGWQLLLVASLGTALSFWRIEHYPAPWFDEGLTLEVAKNLALHGKYALHSVEGYRLFDPAIQTGPTVVAPMALSFEVFGVGLWQARFVMAIFSVAFLMLYFRLATVLYDRPVAWVALLLILSFGVHSEFLSYLFVARQALGEVAALAFFTGGLLLWRESVRVASAPRLLASGVVFGLAMLTKSQFVLLIPPVIFVAWWMGRSWHGGLSWRHLTLVILSCGATVIGWYVVQAISVGSVQASANAVTLREGFVVHVLEPFVWMKMRNAASVLVRSGFVLWGTASLVFACIRIRSGSGDPLLRAAVVAFVAIWMGWYAFGSIGWARYAFPGIALCHVLSAALLVELWRTRPMAGVPWTMAWNRVPGLVAAWLLIVGVVSGIPAFRGMASDRNDDYFAFGDYLNLAVQTTDVVESWEWELDLIADVSFHHPPTDLTFGVTEDIWLRRAAREQSHRNRYSLGDVRPTHVVVGPFARYTRLYDRDIARAGTLMKTVGRYSLYRMAGTAWD